jgi:N-acyl homoserine lactone hydrolase
MSVKALYLMYGGSLILRKGFMVYGAHDGDIIEAPILITLIECDEGNILFDTGLHSGGISDPKAIWGEQAVSLFSPRMKKEYDIQELLKNIGFSTNDIDIVVNSHLHWDHIGGNRLFTRSRILVQKEEYRYACFPDTYNGLSYMKNHIHHPSLQYELIEGDQKIYDGVSLISTTGHTPGHQSLIVKLKNTGPLILSGDAIPLEVNFDQNILPGGLWSAPDAYKSILRLKHLADILHGRIIFPHDIDFLNKCKLAPHCYD